MIEVEDGGERNVRKRMIELEEAKIEGYKARRKGMLIDRSG